MLVRARDVTSKTKRGGWRMATPLQELEGAEQSYERVRAEMDALHVDQLARRTSTW